MKTTRLATVMTLALMTLVLTGCSGGAGAAAPSATPEPIMVTGSVSVPPRAYFVNGTVISEGDPCTAKAGYDDITEGAQVVVTDASNKTVALGGIDGGAIHIPAGGAPISGRCEFRLQVDDVPPGEKFYGVHVGNTNRGAVQYTAKQLQSGLEITIG